MTLGPQRTLKKAYSTAPYNTAGKMMLNPTHQAQGPAQQTSHAHERASVAWSNDDDSHLMEYRAKGYNWAQIASHFTGKSANACRKRHERLMEKKNSENYDTVKTEDLANAYMECREEMWRILASKLGESKWQTIETKCMEKGLKNLQTAHRSRKNSRVFTHASSPNSSAGGFNDDSGLGPDLDPTGQHPPSSSGSQHPMYNTGHQSHPLNMSYSSYTTSGAYAPSQYSMPPLSSSLGAQQTLPPLNQGFSHGHSHLPPVFNHIPRSSGQIMGTYA